MVTAKTPRVSVILPTYNRVKFLGRAIQSVLDQSFKEWELIVVDDASTDETPETLKEWQRKDARIRVITSAENCYPDISKTLNKGLQSAQGDYIARIDDDDYWCSKDKLKKQVEFLDSHPAFVVVGSGVVVIDGEGKELFRYLKWEHDDEIRKHALFANPFSHTTAMFRKDIALEVGGYGPLRYAEDWDLWLKIGTKGKLYNIPEYLVVYMLTGQNKSFTHQRAQGKIILEFLRWHKGEYPRFVFAYTLNLFAYWYSFLPLSIRKGLHSSLSHLKRKAF